MTWGIRWISLAGCLLFGGCTTLGEDFDDERAAQIHQGMTRDQVIAVMGSPPSQVEGNDSGRLVWLYAVADPIGFGVTSKRLAVSFDHQGLSEPVPKGGPQVIYQR